MHNIDALLEKARAQGTKIDSINVICDEMRAILASGAANEEKLDQLEAILGESNAKLDEVISENTPNEPA